MLSKLIKMKNSSDMIKSICLMLDSVYRNALKGYTDFSWDTVPDFDKEHYKKLFHMLRNGACSVKSVPITDEVLKRELWDFARCYTIFDENNNLAYTYLVGSNRFSLDITSDKTKNAMGLHVGDLDGAKLQENFLSKSLGMLLYDIVFPEVKSGRLPEVVRVRLFNDSRNTVKRNGKKYELYDKDGSLILSVEPAKTFFTRRDTVQIKCPRKTEKLFNNLSVEECKSILGNLSKRYSDKSK